MTNWSEVVREYGPIVWRTAYRLLANEADAADCFQKTFLAAIELAAAQAVRNWPGVLKRIATARALDQLRGRLRDSLRFARFPEELPQDLSSHDPVDVAAGGELATALRLALCELDPQQAELFCLVRLEGMSNQDAATVLGITANHTGVLLHRARAALRARLAAFDPSREHTREANFERHQ